MLNRLWPFRKFARPVRRQPAIPILTYHSANAHGYEYASNDHLALESDLRVIRDLGFRVAPLDDVVAWLTRTGGSHLEHGRWVALTFDDAPDWDFFDLIHPDVGCLKSFYRLLVEAADATPADAPPPTGTSFVIADPGAREIIDRACLAGRGHWRDFWWHDAASTGVLRIANHSWDHAHAALPAVRQREQRKGTFMGIDNEADADAQIVRAQRYIWMKTAGLVQPHFAYPYGDAPDYLVTEYFPNLAETHGIVAAFGTQGEHAAQGCNRWHVPRFVFGEHWRTPEEFRRILVQGDQGG